MLKEIVDLCNESSNVNEYKAAVLGVMEREVGFDVAFFSSRGEASAPTVMRIDAAVVERAVSCAPVYLKELQPVKQEALRAP